MPTITPQPLPDDALLARYRENGAYTDCYAIDLPGEITQQAFVTAFYTSPAFRLERMILSLLMRKPSSDADVAELAAGTTESFAAWTVEARSQNQLLLCDYQSRTRSWLMAGPLSGGGTRLYFGSAVVPVTRDQLGKPSMGSVFHALLGFHRIYSRILLRSAARRVGR